MKKRSTLLSSVAMIVILCLLVTGVSWPTDVKAANECVLFNKDNVSASYIIDSSWEGAFNATVTVKNDSEKDIEDWRISFDYDNVIENIWNASVEKYDEGSYVIVNNGWNQDIKAKSAISFGFTAKGDCSKIPTSVKLVSEYGMVKTDDYIADFCLYNEWENGFSGAVILTNTSAKDIEDFTLEFDFDGTISNLWNGIIESSIDNHYVIKNADYNQRINSGESVIIGFNGKKNRQDAKPNNYSLYTYGYIKETAQKPTVVTTQTATTLYTQEPIATIVTTTTQATTTVTTDETTTQTTTDESTTQSTTTVATTTQDTTAATTDETTTQTTTDESTTQSTTTVATTTQDTTAATTVPQGATTIDLKQNDKDKNDLLLGEVIFSDESFEINEKSELCISAKVVGKGECEVKEYKKNGGTWEYVNDIYDNGDISNSHDEIKNDGIYSNVIIVSSAIEKNDVYKVSLVSGGEEIDL